MADPKQHSQFQITSFVDNANVDTFSDHTLVTRNPRCGQWVKLGWLDRRSRFIGVTRSGVLVLDHTSGGDFKAFSRKVQAFKRANDRI
jgi:hypothetical protein